MKRIRLIWSIVVLCLWSCTQIMPAKANDTAKAENTEALYQTVEAADSSQPEEYYREWTMTFADGRKRISGRLWVKKDMWREEVNGSSLITIGKREQQSSKLWKISGKRYCQLEPDMFELHEEVLGEDAVGNKATQKVRSITNFYKGPTFQAGISKVTVLQWLDPANGLPVKEKSDNGSGTISVKEYTKLQIGPQDGALFQIPFSYEECVSIDELLSKAKEASRSPSSAQDKIESTAERALDRILDGWLRRI